MAHPVLWFDVMGKDGKSLGSFYSKLFGWEFKQEDTEGIAYGVLISALTLKLTEKAAVCSLLQRSQNLLT